MKYDIQLHIFTNAVDSAPDLDLIEQTYRSFCHTFGDGFDATIWCDSHPNIDRAPAYIDNLRRRFGNVHETTSLSDGYARAVQSSTADYLFMLEHDWQFLPNIKHSLAQIAKVMYEQNLLHLRFNKRSNLAKKSDINLRPIEHAIMPYCLTDFLSNNPHMIDRVRYVKEALPLITVREKSFGIEKNLSQGGLIGAIYGPAGYPATIAHLDGKSFSADRALDKDK